jgi:predicted dithiol-disulfide oxidoreductase (DUF899 family)
MKTTQNHRVVSGDEWVAERKALLAHEKELTRLGDQIARERRALPWVRVDKTYTFDTSAGRRTLADLFDGRRQLLAQHFMLAPGWEQGCKNCSYMADHTDSATVHLAPRDVTFVAISRAPLAEIERFRRRMSWKFAWVSSHGNDFNRDFHVSFTADEMANGEADYNFGGAPAGEEMPGVSVFWKDDAGQVFHTYSTYGRGVEVMMHTYRLLDLTCPYRKPKTADGHPRSVDNRCYGRALQVDLVGGGRTVPAAVGVAGGNPRPSTSTQCAEASISEAGGGQQHRSAGVHWALSAGS